MKILGKEEIDIHTWIRIFVRKTFIRFSISFPILLVIIVPLVVVKQYFSHISFNFFCRLFWMMGSPCIIRNNFGNFFTIWTPTIYVESSKCLVWIWRMTSFHALMLFVSLHFQNTVLYQELWNVSSNTLCCPYSFSIFREDPDSHMLYRHIRGKLH